MTGRREEPTVSPRERLLAAEAIAERLWRELVRLEFLTAGGNEFARYMNPWSHRLDEDTFAIVSKSPDAPGWA